MSRSLKYRTGETKTIRIPKRLESHVQHYVHWLDQVVGSGSVDLVPEEYILLSYLVQMRESSSQVHQNGEFEDSEQA